MSATAKTLLAIGLLALTGCPNPFGLTYPDVCAKYPNQTCIALGLGCPGESLDIDQLQITSTTPGLIPDGTVSTPTPPSTISLPAIIAILPDKATFMGGKFSLSISATKAGVVKVKDYKVEGTVAVGAKVSLNTDRDSGQCLAGAIAVQVCPTCCSVDDKGNFVQANMNCSTDPPTVCAPGPNPGVYACQPCGDVGLPACASANGCGTKACRSSGNNGATCVPVGAACDNAPLFCLYTQPGAAPSCARCGEGDGETCCVPNADMGVVACNFAGCCDVGTNRCVGVGRACKATNTSCQMSASDYQCQACGASGGACCPAVVAGPPETCIVGNCDLTTQMCP